MKRRYHSLIIIGLLLVGLVIGSFYDLQIDEALFHEKNGFGLFMASFGVYPCHFCLSFIGGGLLCTTVRRKDLTTFMKLCGYGLSAVAFILAVWLCGKEWPSSNGHNVPQLAPLSYAICAIVFGGSFCLGYMVCRKGDQRQLWNICLILGIAFAVSLFPSGFAIKLFVHRPRYRMAVYYGGADAFYYNWWEMFPNYKEFIGKELAAGITLTKEEFKSFPSGHSGSSIILAAVLPFISQFFPKLKGKELFFFYGGAAYGFLMMFSRLLVGAHYLTDTCMGALIVMVTFYIANEVILRKGLLKETKKEEPSPALAQ